MIRHSVRKSPNDDAGSSPRDERDTRETEKALYNEIRRTIIIAPTARRWMMHFPCRAISRPAQRLSICIATPRSLVFHRYQPSQVGYRSRANERASERPLIANLPLRVGLSVTNTNGRDAAACWLCIRRTPLSRRYRYFAIRHSLCCFYLSLDELIAQFSR